MSLFSRVFKKPGPPGQSAGRPGTAGEPDTGKPAPSANAPDPAALVRAQEAELAAALAAGDRAAIARWAIEGSTTHLRQQAARAIDDPAQLAELITASRGRDKHVYRILNGKREAMLAAERALRERESELAAAAAALEKHAGRTWDRTYADTLARLETRWNAVAAGASEPQRLAAATHLAQARATIEAHQREQAAEEERRREAARQADQARRARELAAEEAAAKAAAQAQQVEAQRAAAREQAQAQRAAEDAAIGELLSLLRQAQAALGHGGTARAARLRDTLRHKLPAAPAHALPAWFDRQLQDLDARIDELKDWKTFTVVPKRTELLRRMQSLIGAEMSAEELARQVRRLRDEWRTLHRGAADEPGPEREQFEQLAERAYEPCREHFARQAATRAANRERRQALLERLRAFIARQAADSPPDLRLLQQVLTEARREWREHAPVDQDAVKPLQEQLAALLDPLQETLDAGYAANAQARRDLITRAVELATASDTRAAIQQARELQRAWKQLGPVRRKDSDALWEEFHRHCDAVFQRSAQEAAAHGASLESQRARAAALCEEAERAAALRDEALTEASRQLGGWRQEFDSLELPRAAARELRQRFQRAVEACEAALRRERASGERRGLRDALHADALLRACAPALLQGTPEAEAAERLAAAREALDRAPRPLRAALQRRFDGMTARTVASDPEAAAVRLRMLCVRAEIAAGLPSPPEDAELRRGHQMQRLVGAMTQGRRAESESPQDLLVEWVECDAAGDPAAQRDLALRFARALGLEAGA